VVEWSNLRVVEPSSGRVFEPSSPRLVAESVGGAPHAARCARRCSRQAQACRLELRRASRCPRQRSCTDSRRLGCQSAGWLTIRPTERPPFSVFSLLSPWPHLPRRRRHPRYILGLYMSRHAVVPDAIPGVFGQVLAVRRGKGTHEQQLTGESTPPPPPPRPPPTHSSDHHSLFHPFVLQVAVATAQNFGIIGNGKQVRTRRRSPSHPSPSPPSPPHPPPPSFDDPSVRSSRRSAARHQRVSLLRHRRRAV